MGAAGDLGPLDVTTRLTTGVGSTFDVGVAAVRLDTPGFVGLSITANDVRFSSPADLANTLTSFGDVEAVAASLLARTVAHLGEFATVGALIGLLLALATHRPLFGRSARKRIRRATYTAGAWLAVGTLATSIIGPSANLASRSWIPVVGLSVEGQVLPDVQVAGNLLNETVRVLEENEDFYEQLRTTTASAMAAISDEDAERGLAAFLFESDLHCNLGMTRVISEVALQAGAEFVLSGGDITMSGTELEALCTDVYLRRLGATPLVLVLGNHDSDRTGLDLSGGGAAVLRGEPIRVGGLTLLGDSDPHRSQIGVSTTLRGDETVPEFIDRMAETACDTNPDILLIHDPAHAADAIEDGCAPLVLSGHRHREEGPTRSGDSVTYTVDNSGGTGQNTPSYGPLATDSAVALFYFDPDTEAVIGLRTVQFAEQGSVTIGDYRLLDPPKVNREN